MHQILEKVDLHTEYGPITIGWWFQTALNGVFEGLVPNYDSSLYEVSLSNLTNHNTGILQSLVDESEISEVKMIVIIIIFSI